jgi:lysyl-tRNA synthetase class 1
MTRSWRSCWPSLREERQQTYSCFLPIHPETGRVLYVPIKHVDAKNGTITFDDGRREWTLPVTGGHVKLQWKPDFGARWAALDVDFEMYGKDHSTNTPIYDGICEVLGGRKPEHFTYELFLDRAWAKDQQIQGQRAVHRRMADLCGHRKPVLFHVSKAQDRQADVFRCDPQGGG